MTGTGTTLFGNLKISVFFSKSEKCRPFSPCYIFMLYNENYINLYLIRFKYNKYIYII